MKTIVIQGEDRSIAADVFESGDRWVLLCHGKVFDKSDWGLLPQTLERSQVSVLAINFSGYGESSGAQDSNQYPYDIETALTWLQQQNPSSISVIGASMGAIALLHWAQSIPTPMTLETTVLFAPRAAPKAIIPTRALHCVFNECEDDVADHSQSVEANLPNAQLHFIPGTAHAQNNFKQAQADQVVNTLSSLILGS